jgi:hypothetical protein
MFRSYGGVERSASRAQGHAELTGWRPKERLGLAGLMCVIKLSELQTRAAALERFQAKPVRVWKTGQNTQDKKLNRVWDSIVAVCCGMCLSVGLVATSAGREIGHPGKVVPFDISARPLAQALDAYARTTGMAALVDQDLVAGHRSASVKGRLTPDQALRILLAGTGLSVRYASGGAFTLETATGSAVAETAANVGDGDLRANHQGYFADLQDSLTQVLCRGLETRPGRYRLGVQLWIGPNGAVLASHLLDTTGDGQRDAFITDLLESATVAVPPAELPQPVTLVLLTHPAEPPACRETGQRSK